jgi:hypothetical protein
VEIILWIITLQTATVMMKTSCLNGMDTENSFHRLIRRGETQVMFILKLQTTAAEKKRTQFRIKKKIQHITSFYFLANHSRRELSRNEKNVYAHSGIKAVLLRLCGSVLR